MDQWGNEIPRAIGPKAPKSPPKPPSNPYPEFAPGPPPAVSHSNTRCKRDHRARVAELFGWAVGLGDNIVPEINVSIANITGVLKLSRVS